MANYSDDFGKRGTRKMVVPWQAVFVLQQIARGREELQRHILGLETALRTDALTGVLNRVGFDNK